jgi:hypothetical protein
LEAIATALTNVQIKRWATEDQELLARLAIHSQTLISRPALLSSLDFDLAWPILGKPHMARSKRLGLLEAALMADGEEFIEAATASWPDGIELLLDAWGGKKLEKVPVAEWDHLLESGGTLSDFTLALLFLAAADPDTGLGPQTAVRAFDGLYAKLRSAAKLKPKALERLQEAADDRKAPPLEQVSELLATGFVGGKWPVEELLSIENPAALREVLASPGAAPLIAALIPVLDSSGATKKQGEIIWNSLFASEDVSFIEKALTPLREAILWPSRFLKR